MAYMDDQAPYLRLDGVVGQLRDGELHEKTRAPGTLTVQRSGALTLEATDGSIVWESHGIPGGIQLNLVENVPEYEGEELTWEYLLKVQQFERVPLFEDNQGDLLPHTAVGIELSGHDGARSIAILAALDGTSIDINALVEAEEEETDSVASFTPIGRPAPRLVRDVSETEEHVTSWVRWMGWPEASRTALSKDGGVDVIGTDPDKGTVVAQVKFEAKPAGSPALQALVGAGLPHHARHFLFFTSAGYTDSAWEYASQVGMGLFQFTYDGDVEAVNRHAWDYFPE